MEELPNFHLHVLQGRLRDLAYEFTRVRYAASHPEMWRPAVNVYRCRSGIVIAAELAGTHRSQVELRVEPRRVWVCGHRPAPEPPASEGPALQVLAMEIDHGRFEREIRLPADVVPGQVVAEQREGLLWIFLPLAEES